MGGIRAGLVKLIYALQTGGVFNNGQASLVEPVRFSKTRFKQHPLTFSKKNDCPEFVRPYLFPPTWDKLLKNKIFRRPYLFSNKGYAKQKIPPERFPRSPRQSPGGQRPD
jgi:hypothetical protein